MSGWQKRQAPPPQVTPRIRALLKRVPGLRRAWRGLRAIKQRWRDEPSLPALLHPSSPYHAEFMPIYETVAQRPSDALEAVTCERHLVSSEAALDAGAVLGEPHG